MPLYYLSRALISLAVGGLLALTGSPWWSAALAGTIVFGWFLWAPRSGRYAVHPELGVTALRRDERTQIINYKAARNGFIIVSLAIAAIKIYFGAVVGSAVPVALLGYTLVLAAVTYFLSDLGLRRS
ncbi:MAG: hypothetical protein A2W33_10685 [Chloroflexi bacterium RBG_16_52_11]|nr:MAG: hypothetical protein A2W33_10685 [Chloroflexi bacterium RBG_16_52_11]